MYGSNGLLKFDGKTYTAYSVEHSGLPERSITALTVDPDNALWIGTLHEGLAVFNEPVINARVPLDASADATPPARFCVRSNYPNPFNPDTAIPVTVLSRCAMRITLFNSNGQCVRHLINSSIETGEHIFYWDGQNDHRQPLPSGMYLCRISSGQENKILKLLLIR